MDKVVVTKSKLDILAQHINEKAGTTGAKTIAQMQATVDGITVGGGAPSLQSKSVTYTSNGTATITPDEGYDGLSSVDVTVNVSSVSTVTINCESDDSSALWISPDGVFHKTKLNAGANTIIVTTNSLFGVYNVYLYKMTNLNNIVYSGYGADIETEYVGQTQYFYFYYATAATASATQPTD